MAWAFVTSLNRARCKLLEDGDEGNGGLEWMGLRGLRSCEAWREAKVGESTCDRQSLTNPAA